MLEQKIITIARIIVIIIIIISSGIISITEDGW